MFPRGIDQWYKMGWIHCIIVDYRIADITANIACFVQLVMKFPGLLRMEIFNAYKK